MAIRGQGGQASGKRKARTKEEENRNRKRCPFCDYTCDHGHLNRHVRRHLKGADSVSFNNISYCKPINSFNDQKDGQHTGNDLHDVGK